jgi:nucleoside-diphosphate-sugar epimerase
MNYVLGASGILGSAIAAQFCDDELQIIPRSLYETWCDPAEIERFLKFNSVSDADTFFVCSGITDPSSKPYQLLLFNSQIPLNIISQVKMFNAKVITFGSILENTAIENAYIQSKRDFFKKACQDIYYSKHLHFQLHTVFGSLPPKSHMLLGKFLDSIKQRTTLEMTSGEQYREYWHSSDIVKLLFSREWITENKNHFQISSGQPIQIANLATRVLSQIILKTFFIEPCSWIHMIVEALCEIQSKV